MAKITVAELRRNLDRFAPDAIVYVDGEEFGGIVGSEDEHGYTISIVPESDEDFSTLGYFWKPGDV